MSESAALPDALPPAAGFVWIAAERGELEARLAEVQAALARLAGTQLVELHVQDLLNPQLPSQYDYTSQYDVLVFRRLATLAVPGQLSAPPGAGQRDAAQSAASPPAGTPARALDGQGGGGAAASSALLRRIDTSPVGFAVFDRVLLSVHPVDCAVRDAFAARLFIATTGTAGAVEPRAAAGRVATSPADLMLRLVNLMVDGFLELRRELTQQLDHWQDELLNPSKKRATNWSTMLDVRLSLHDLDQIGEDQRAAVRDWTDMVETWPEGETPSAKRERDLLLVRSRDLLEHIERVVSHVRRLEQSAETTVQMHFSAQSNRTNDIMRILTVLTAVFLPLNLIAGIFGMNFDAIPLLHKAAGFWIAMGSMLAIAIGLVIFFWRKRYLEHNSGK